MLKHFFVEYKASMKRGKRRVIVKLDRRNGKVESGSCTSPAWNSAYFNNIIVVLLSKFADYSLDKVSRVLEEISCTSCLRQSGSLVRNTHLNYLLCKLSWKNYQQNEEYLVLFMTFEK